MVRPDRRRRKRKEETHHRGHREDKDREDRKEGIPLPASPSGRTLPVFSVLSSLCPLCLCGESVLQAATRRVRRSEARTVATAPELNARASASTPSEKMTPPSGMCDSKRNSSP